jgi:hypothetical protein
MNSQVQDRFAQMFADAEEDEIETAPSCDPY